MAETQDGPDQMPDDGERISADDVNRVDYVQLAVASKLRRKSMRELPRLLVSAAQLLWTSGRRVAATTFAVQGISALAIAVQVVLVKIVLDRILAANRASGSIRDALLPTIGLVLVNSLTSIAAIVGGLQQRLMGELVDRQVQRQVLDVTQAVDLSDFEDPDFYDQARRVEFSATARTLQVTQAMVSVVTGGIGMAAGIIAIVALAPVLLPLLLLSGIPLFVVARRGGRLEFAFAVQQTMGQRQRYYFTRVLTGRDQAKEVRAFALGELLRSRWDQSLARYLADLTLHLRRRTRLALLGNLLSGLLTAAALAVALSLVAKGQLSLSSAGAALFAVRLLAGRISSVVTGVGAIYECALFLEDLQSFLARQPAAIASRSTLPAPKVFEEIRLDGVTYTYPQASRPSLQHVDVTLRRGQVVALVGENGSGKTTLAKLLAALYEPDEGAVRWDGRDIRSFDPDSLRRRTAVIFQDFVRYQLSARDNIGLGYGDGVSDEQVRAAAEKSGAARLLERLPAGYETLLSKEYAGGVDLSLGQWQRVALARAFIRDAPLVILDEPSASLDARAEHELFQKVRTLLGGRTVLLISHRFSTVLTADRIYVLKDGQVVEQGSHAELLAAAGLYAELFTLQASAYLDRAGPDLESLDEAAPH